MSERRRTDEYGVEIVETYNEQGNLIRLKKITPDKDESLLVYEYDENNTLVNCTHYGKKRNEKQKTNSILT